MGRFKAGSGRRRRGPRRRQRDEALRLWHALVSGEWTLLGEFERDGRRYILASHDPPVEAASRLTDRQRQVVKHLLLAHSEKVIAAEMGVSKSTVSTHVAHLSARLRLERVSCADLAAIAPQLRPALRPGQPGESRMPPELGSGNAPEEGAPPIFLSVQPLEHGGREWALLSFPLIAREIWEPLTSAERVVATLLLRGLTNAAIGARRRCSRRTVANQVSSIFEKLGVHSRAELRTRVLGGAAEPSHLSPTFVAV